MKYLQMHLLVNQLLFTLMLAIAVGVAVAVCCGCGIENEGDMQMQSQSTSSFDSSTHIPLSQANETTEELLDHSIRKLVDLYKSQGFQMGKDMGKYKANIKMAMGCYESIKRNECISS